MTSFFVPDHPGKAAAERAYDAIRDAAEATTGYCPTETRIASVACRRDGSDIVAEVGKKVPESKHPVTAILDLGRARPYLIHCGPPDAGSQMLVEKPVYAVTEFRR